MLKIAIEEKLKEITKNYLIIESDISMQADVLKIFDETEQKFGNANILVNNAAFGSDKDTIFSVTNNTIDETFDVNVKGTLMMIREFVKRYINQNGKIINFSSDNAYHSFSDQIIYGASKAAIESLTRTIACEVEKLGITINAIAPGLTQAAWINKILEKEVLPSIPLARLGTPEDIANMILFLASEKASWITGQVIRISGGHEL
ncbi:MAG: SDR family oxidoreductase [Endomicrobium sp.]|jgi:3-oxoacyl-[acyl-carrier protein] reductase|nr:SDR family oxidoreductase [Endomicrobium sp.]